MPALPEYLPPILKRIADKEGFTSFTTDFGSGSNIGDNFSGELLTAVISGRQKQKDGGEIDAKLNLLCKLASANAQRRKDFTADLSFCREAYFYNTLAPDFIRFQQEKGLAEEDQFRAFPKCFEAVFDPENGIYAIIMQDLRPEGFAMWPKCESTPPPYCRLFIREVAKLHAISFAMKDQQPEKFEKYKKLNELFSIFIKTSNNVDFFRSGYKRAIGVLNCEEHKEIMRDVDEKILDYVESCMGRNAAEAFGVVSHGDSWNNNMLFRTNDEETVEEICFVDWQELRYASPANDLLFYLCCAIRKKTRDEEFGNLLREYYGQLSRNIRKMGSNPDKLFPYDAFKKELKLCGNIAFLIAPVLIEVSLADSKDVSDLNETCDKVANGEQTSSLIQGLSSSAQIEHKKYINEFFEDFVSHGYFRKVEN